MNRGIQFHRLAKSKDLDFWSVRANDDIRPTVHKMASSLLLRYVDRHDPAYAWAERRKIERHPKTGATHSVFNGSPAEIRILDDQGREIDVVTAWIAELVQEDLLLREIGVFVRSEAELDRGRSAVERVAGQVGSCRPPWTPSQGAYPSARCNSPRDWNTEPLS